MDMTMGGGGWRGIPREGEQRWVLRPATERSARGATVQGRSCVYSSLAMVDPTTLRRRVPWFIFSYPLQFEYRHGPRNDPADVRRPDHQETEVKHPMDFPE